MFFPNTNNFITMDDEYSDEYQIEQFINPSWFFSTQTTLTRTQSQSGLQSRQQLELFFSFVPSFLFSTFISSSLRYVLSKAKYQLLV